MNNIKQMNMNNICKIPVCLYCKYIITIQSLTVDYLNDVYINYQCNCKRKGNIKLQKYLYGLDLLNGISFDLDLCGKCRRLYKSNIHLYCIQCSDFICEQCYYQNHKEHLLSKYQVKHNKSICGKHNISHTLFCLTCKNGICIKCSEEEHINHKYKKFVDFSIKDFTAEEKIQNKCTLHNICDKDKESLIQLLHLYLDQLEKTNQLSDIYLCIIISLYNIDTIIKTPKPKIKYKKQRFLGPLITKGFPSEFYTDGYFNVVVSPQHYILIKKCYKLNNGNILLFYITTRSQERFRAFPEPLYSAVALYDYNLSHRLHSIEVSCIIPYKNDQFILSIDDTLVFMDYSTNSPTEIKNSFTDISLRGGFVKDDNVLIAYNINDVYILNLNEETIEDNFELLQHQIDAIMQMEPYKDDQVFLISIEEFVIWNNEGILWTYEGDSERNTFSLGCFTHKDNLLLISETKIIVDAAIHMFDLDNNYEEIYIVGGVLLINSNIINENYYFSSFEVCDDGFYKLRRFETGEVTTLYYMDDHLLDPRFNVFFFPLKYGYIGCISRGYYIYVFDEDFK